MVTLSNGVLGLSSRTSIDSMKNSQKYACAVVRVCGVHECGACGEC